MIDTNLLEILKTKLGIKDEGILMCTRVNVVGGKPSGQYTLLLTEYSFHLADQRNAPAFQCFWDEIIKVGAPNERRIYLQTKLDVITMEFDAADKIANCIMSHILNLTQGSPLTEGERVKSVKPTRSPFAPLMRFKFNAGKKEKHFPNRILINYEHALATMDPYFDLAFSLDSEDAQITALESIYNDPNISSVNLPLYNSYENHISLIKKSPTVRAMILHEPIGRDTSKFLRAISETKDTQITRLTFEKTRFDQQTANILQEVLTTSKIHAITFIDAVPGDVANQAIQRASSLNHLNELHFIRSPGIDMPLLLQRATCLREVTFTDCQVEISAMLRAAFNTSIHSIHIEGSYLRADFGVDFQLTTSLDVIHLPGCHFLGDSLYSLLILLVQLQSSTMKLSIDLTDLVSESDSWKQLFSPTTLAALSLTELIWNHNEIFPGFFEYLATCPLLSKLSLVGCNIPPEPLSRYLSTGSMLVELNISETGPHLIEPLGMAQQLSTVIYESSRLGVQGLCKFASVVNNSKCIRTISCFNNGIMSGRQLLEFFNVFETRRQSLNILSANREISTLKRMRAISANDATTIRASYARLRNTTLRRENEFVYQEVIAAPNEPPELPPIPDYEKSQVWRVGLMSIPKVDIGPIVQQLEEAYTIPTLSEQLYPS